MLLLASLFALQADEPINREPFGPFSLRTLASFQVMRLGLKAEDPETLPPDGLEIYNTTDWSNLWARSVGEYRIDGERVRIGTGVRYGLARGIELGVEIPMSWRGEGILDQPIEAFHRIFHFPDDQRDTVPRNDFLVEVVRKDGTVFRLDDEEIGTDDMTMSAKVRFAHSEKWDATAALMGTVKLPTGNVHGFFGSGKIDGGLSLLLSQHAGPLWFYGGLGVVYFGDEEFSRIELRRWQRTGFFAVEVPMSESFSLLGQYMVSTGTAQNLYSFSDPVNEGTIGFKLRLRHDILFEAALVENVFNYKVSPDVTFHVGLTILLDPGNRG